MLLRAALACMLLATVAAAQSNEDPLVVFTRREIAKTATYRPSAGYVPDAKAAVAIATAVLTPIYEKADIGSEEPWHTGLKGEVWTVVGTFHGRGLGGSAVIQLDKETGKVLFVGHTQ
jgi:hypothetical protein